ncbi:MAG: gliding motility-associated C-terminal domain-containing protein [Bacteroidia bacterium]|nr:gliding motility-associated C-terminal domain-containing protein [Bacteroidia bacterium]
MKRLSLILLILYPLLSRGQINLVRNPSFEDTISCPTVWGNITPFLKYWHNPTDCSPDYYNACAADGSSCDVPYNLGYMQYPRTGNAYCGIYGYGTASPPSDVREYIQGELIDTLAAGKNYCVSFYVNLANLSRYSISNIGAYFSNNLISISNSCLNLPFTPQIISNPSVQLTDTVNWMIISGEFIANGDEQYITIGNFYSNTNTDTLMFNPSPFGTANIAYYYIEDVSVVCCDCEQENSDIFVANAFSPNGDGINDVIHAKGDIKELDFRIFNRWGEQVFYTNDASKGWDGTFNGLELNNGVFFYVLSGINNIGERIELKGNISLIK